jgi:hypothetical protein
MAEIKNTFLKSKMNRDLDDRLIPKGEYRRAVNISVSKSEDSDVGALENVIGNNKAAGEKPYSNTFDIIGYYSDDTNNRIITFVTNYTDNYIDGHSTHASVANEGRAAAGEELFDCHICIFNKADNVYRKVVTGDFLNFSKSDSVLGVSLIEDLLFFTDNRNQPRKINLSKATNDISYYKEEHNISVAKYSPVEPISLVKVAKHRVAAAGTGKTITFSSANEISNVEVGMTAVGKSSTSTSSIVGLEAADFVTVESIAGAVVTTKKQSAGDPSFTLGAGDEVTFLKSTMSNEENDDDWPGDPKFMEEKFIRFSYRFKFDDGEYSLMAPFTQAVFVPKQKGYFFRGDEDSAFRSTIVDFMKNEINNVKLIISLPSEGEKIKSDYKISNVEILYKESDGAIVKVLESVSSLDIENLFPETNQYVYDYQSRKPFINLTEADLTRVYDKTPVRALAQETTGNRVMYANFCDKHTPPKNIDYNVGVSEKETINDYSFVEYPNHTAKQNRNYQVGFVLADKFGRQSPVILSPIETSPSSTLIGGSTIYHPYPDSNNSVKDWFGDQIKVRVNKVISSGIEGGQPDITNGEPGLYAIPLKQSGSGEGFAVADAYFQGGDKTRLYYVMETNNPAGTTPNKNTNQPTVGSYLRGANRDYVKVTAKTGSGGVNQVVADGAISDIYLKKVYLPSTEHDIKFAYKINPTGWYSYKVVVKQSEQEYYNCYLPGVLNGYPTAKSGDGNPVYPTNEDGETAHVVLINDNINKIPRDLVEVGPEQKQYRSSVELFGRVENFYITTPTANYTNKQYYPGRKSDLVSTIAQASELASDAANITSPQNFYQVDTDPLIGRISTLSGGFGTPTANMEPKLAIYETKPTISLLDIFWETSSVGLISDLNSNILTAYAGPIGLTDSNFQFNENQIKMSGTSSTTGDVNSPYITDYFWPVTFEGDEVTNTGSNSAAIGFLSSYTGPQFSVTNANDTDVSSRFSIEQDTTVGSSSYGAYRVKITDYQPYGSDALLRQFTFRISVYTNDGEWTPEFTFQGSMENTNPYLWRVNGLGPKTPVSPGGLNTITISAGPAYNILPWNLDSLASMERSRVCNGVNLDASEEKRTEEVGVYMTQGPPKRSAADNDMFIGVKSVKTSLAMRGRHDKTNGHENGGVDIGEYDYVLEVKDALTQVGSSAAKGLTSNGEIESSDTTKVTYNQKIVVIPDRIEEALKTPCIVKGINGAFDPTPAYRQIGAVSDFGDSVERRTYQWYIGNSTEPDRPDTANDFSGPDDPYDPNNPSPTDWGATRLGTIPYSITGSGVKTVGTIQLDLMLEARAAYPYNGLPYGTAEWTIWYRSNSNAAWGSALDTNNRTFNGTDAYMNTYADPGTSATTNYSSSNAVLAFDRKGEYFIQAYAAAHRNAQVKVWVNVNDANYPTCVPCFGKNLIEDASTSERNASWFQYSYSESTDSTAHCATSIPNTGYGRTPYTSILTQLYADNDFTSFIAKPEGKRLYQYDPGSSFTNLTSAQVDVIGGINSRRQAKFKNMTQTLTTSPTAVDPDTYKTNKFFIDTSSSGLLNFSANGGTGTISGTASRISCQSNTWNTAMQRYDFENYSI